MVDCLIRRFRGGDYERLRDQSPDGVSGPAQLQPEISTEPEPKVCIEEMRMNIYDEFKISGMYGNMACLAENDVLHHQQRILRTFLLLWHAK